jgi:hypothetical protein
MIMAYFINLVHIQQNGIDAESTIKTISVDCAPCLSMPKCKLRHLLENTLALLFQTSVPAPYWSDVVLPTCYLINCMPSLSLVVRSLMLFCLLVKSYTIYTLKFLGVFVMFTS